MSTNDATSRRAHYRGLVESSRKSLCGVHVRRMHQQLYKCRLQNRHCKLSQKRLSTTFSQLIDATYLLAALRGDFVCRCFCLLSIKLVMFLSKSCAYCAEWRRTIGPIYPKTPVGGPPLCAGLIFMKPDQMTLPQLRRSSTLPVSCWLKSIGKSDVWRVMPANIFSGGNLVSNWLN